MAEYKYLAPSTTPFDKDTGHSMPNLAYGYTAQAVEVEVDTETGFVRLLRWSQPTMWAGLSTPRRCRVRSRDL